MDLASVYYLGVTFLLFAIFGAIAIRTYSSKHKEKGEAPKYRMMEDEWEESGKESASRSTDDSASRSGSEKDPTSKR
jgi:flagellar biosynthesis/type III secretory pathway M-ring protein FliF/YscJ